MLKDLECFKKLKILHLFIWEAAVQGALVETMKKKVNA